MDDRKRMDAATEAYKLAVAVLDDTRRSIARAEREIEHLRTRVPRLTEDVKNARAELDAAANALVGVVN